ncbi:hypothetical protein VP01_981g1, partial [Puccinia sorghi]
LEDTLETLHFPPTLPHYCRTGPRTNIMVNLCPPRCPHGRAGTLQVGGRTCPTPYHQYLFMCQKSASQGLLPRSSRIIPLFPTEKEVLDTMIKGPWDMA